MLRKHLTAFLFLLRTVAETASSLAVEVRSTFPSGSERCLLDTRDIPAQKIPFGCVTFCQRNPSCLLACISDGKCSLYNLNVSPKWPGASATDLGPSEEKCFSLWAERKDLAPNATFIAPSFHPWIPTTYGVNDGFACADLDVKNIFHTNADNKPWLRADLGSEKWIDKVVIQSRGNVGYANNFDTIEVRVGNVAGNGDFSGNRLLMYYKGPAALGEIVTFKGEKPLLGRYVSVQSMLSSTALIAMEIKITEA